MRAVRDPNIGVEMAEIKYPFCLIILKGQIAEYVSNHASPLQSTVICLFGFSSDDNMDQKNETLDGSLFCWADFWPSAKQEPHTSRAKKRQIKEVLHIFPATPFFTLSLFPSFSILTRPILLVLNNILLWWKWQIPPPIHRPQLLKTLPFFTIVWTIPSSILFKTPGHYGSTIPERRPTLYLGLNTWKKLHLWTQWKTFGGKQW